MMKNSMETCNFGEFTSWVWCKAYLNHLEKETPQHTQFSSVFLFVDVQYFNTDLELHDTHPLAREVMILILSFAGFFAASGNMMLHATQFFIQDNAVLQMRTKTISEKVPQNQTHSRSRLYIE